MSQGLYRSHRVLWMDFAHPGATAADHCCADMAKAVANDCIEHADDGFACADLLVAYSPVFDEYGLLIHDGGASMLLISHCPWCGTKLPGSARDRWFDELEAMGLDPITDDIPDAYRSAEWRAGAS